MIFGFILSHNLLFVVVFLLFHPFFFRVDVVTDAVKSKQTPREVRTSGTKEFCNFRSGSVTWQAPELRTEASELAGCGRN